MKSSELARIFVCIVAFRGFSQGTVNFSNLDPSHGVNAPVYQADGVTALAGSQFIAELIAGPSSNNLASVVTVGFLNRGYFSAGLQEISTVAPFNVAWVQVDVWNTASGFTFAQAQDSGLSNSWWQSSTFTVQLGGSGGAPPSPPAALTGLGTSPVFLNGATVPEPSTIALGLTGAVVALVRLRRPSCGSQTRFSTTAGVCETVA